MRGRGRGAGRRHTPTHTRVRTHTRAHKHALTLRTVTDARGAYRRAHIIHKHVSPAHTQHTYILTPAPRSPPRGPDSIINPEAPLALRLSGQLLLGVVKIHSRKVGYLYADVHDALLKLQAVRACAVCVCVPCVCVRVCV